MWEDFKVFADSCPPVTETQLHLRPNAANDEADTLQAREREHILRIWQATGWKIKGPAGAAIKLGLNPGTLYSRMKKLSVQRPQAR